MRDSDRETLSGVADGQARPRRDGPPRLPARCRPSSASAPARSAWGICRRGPFGFVSSAAAQEAIQPSPEMTATGSKDVGKPFAGTTLKLATESTPPSNAINSQLKKYFEEATGIKVEIEVLPLEQVLQKLTLDVASSLGTYDLYYIDQSWVAASARTCSIRASRCRPTPTSPCRTTTSTTSCRRWSTASRSTTAAWSACPTTSRSSS